MLLNSRHAFYKSKIWADCKQQVYENKKDEYGIVHCEICGRPLIKSFNPKANNNNSSIVFHHTIELTEDNYMDYSISANPELIQTLCFKCHNQVHNRFQSAGSRKVYIISGSPCSGKTTFVKENMQFGDIVVDLDLIWQALSMQSIHIKPDTLKPIIFVARETIEDQIKMRAGNWSNAWVITTKSRQMEVERMATRLNGEVIYMDATKEECLERLKANPDGRDIKLFTQLIEEYYNNIDVSLSNK